LFYALFKEMEGLACSVIMPALVAGIHVFLLCIWHKDVDSRVEPGHDEKPIVPRIKTTALALSVCGRFNGAKGHSQ
jgi:hypothetical protein